MKNLLFAGAVSTCLISGAALAQDKELEDVNRALFASVDANDDGLVSKREVKHYRRLVVLSMDANGDGDVSRKEYMQWDPGWQYLAAQRDRLDLYRNARRKVFRTWDRDGDGRLTSDEQRQSGVKDFFEASDKNNQPMNLKQFKTGLRIVAELNKAFTAPQPVTLINVFAIPAGKEAESLAFWEAAAKFLETQPGYISTALHKSILPDAKFGLINVARWASADAFKKASAKMRVTSGIKPVKGLSFNASLYTVIRSD